MGTERPQNKPVKANPPTQPAEHVSPPSRLPVESERRTTISASASVFVGPLPPPDMLAAYEEAAPGLAEKIIVLLQEQTAHRMQSETERNRANIQIALAAPKYALTAAAMSLVSVTLLGIYGNPWAAAVVGALEVGGMVGMFMRGRRQSSSDKPKTD